MVVGIPGALWLFGALSFGRFFIVIAHLVVVSPYFSPKSDSSSPQCQRGGETQVAA